MDIIIGDRGRNPSASAIITKYSCVSENSAEYWVYGILGISIALVKNTSYGEQLTALIENDVSLETIENFVNELVLKHISIEDFNYHLARIKNEMYMKGKADKAKEIRRALGLGTDY